MVIRVRDVYGVIRISYNVHLSKQSEITSHEISLEIGAPRKKVMNNFASPKIIHNFAPQKRKVGRVNDRAGLEIRYTHYGYRGFESLTFRTG